MNAFIRLLLTFSFFFLANAAHAQETSFDQWNVHFGFPKDWKVTDKDDLGEGNYYLAVEKKGFDSSGLLMINITPGRMNLNDHIKNFEESIGSNITSAKFSAVEPGSYGNYSGVTVGYTFSVMSIDHQATMYCFHVNDKTVIVIAQEADEDHKKNKKGFSQIEKTLRIN